MAEPSAGLNILLETFFHSICTHVTENIVWYKYEQTEQEEKCVVCNVPLKTGDQCRISDCEHNFHANCIARYCDRVEENCPVCKTPVQDKFLSIEEVTKMMKDKSPDQIMTMFKRKSS